MQRFRQRDIGGVISGEIVAQLPDAKEKRFVGVALDGQAQEDRERLARLKERLTRGFYGI